MAKLPPPYYDLEEIPIKANNYKSKEYITQKSKGSYSFSVFICSILIYVSIFYIFNLSPSTFLYNNKFWFFISNTLILIIAADYGAFSSTGGNKNDVYEESYVMYHSQARSNVSSFVSQYQEISSKKNITPKEEEVVTPAAAEALPEVKKEVIVVSDQIDKISRNPNNSFQENGEKETEIREEPAAGECQEESECEFSSMSNEELNRRVEEFIQKFNRQIRLQRAGKLHEI